MKTLLRAAAVAVASTALVATGAVTTGASAAPGDYANVALQPITTSGYKSSDTTFMPATINTTKTINKATVVVNGVPLPGQISVYSNGFYYNRAWGAGAVRLTNFTDYSGQAIAGASNEVSVRYGIESTFNNIRIAKRGKKLTFKIKARYIDNRGVAVGIRKATIQVKKGSKWRTLKNVNLKKNGTKTFKKSDKKKRNYRLVIKTTSLYSGGKTGAIKI